MLLEMGATGLAQACCCHLVQRQGRDAADAADAAATENIVLSFFFWSPICFDTLDNNTT